MIRVIRVIFVITDGHRIVSPTSNTLKKSDFDCIVTGQVNPANVPNGFHAYLASRDLEQGDHTRNKVPLLKRAGLKPRTLDKQPPGGYFALQSFTCPLTMIRHENPKSD